jgi:hypothetical protein
MAAGAAGQGPLNATLSMRDNLQALMAAKQAATVVLKNGTSYRARIGGVGEQHVVLTEPAQKEFFDVLVPFEAIAAVEVRARER